MIRYRELTAITIAYGVHLGGRSLCEAGRHLGKALPWCLGAGWWRRNTGSTEPAAWRRAAMMRDLLAYPRQCRRLPLRGDIDNVTRQITD